VDVTMHAPRTCDACGAPLARGDGARIGLARGATARYVLCLACRPEALQRPAESPASPESPEPAAPAGAAMVAASAPVAFETDEIRRGSLAVWLAVGVLGVAALASSRTGRRVMTTAWVAAKASGRAALAHMRGEQDVGPAVVRHAFEDLGPTYVKLGQLVASSEGMFPEAYCQEFRKCLDRVRPFDFADVQRTLRAELGRDPAEVFASIDPKPLASASIAQVHAARLRDGQEVVIKVQRPGIANVVDADLRVLRLVARAGALHPRGDLANPVAIVQDFEASIREELDFRLEAANMTEFNRIMTAQQQTQVAAPRPLGELSSGRVLVMERFFGCRVDDVARLRTMVQDPEEKLLVGMRAWFQCMVVHGFFHGDVHAGNLMALDDGRIGFLDFGIVGRFPRQRREQVTDYLMAFAAADFRRLAEVMIAMSPGAEGKVDAAALASDLEAAYGPMLAGDSAIKYADVIPAIISAGVRHGMRLPRDFVLVVKQMIYFDRYAKLLAPRLNVFQDPRIVSGLMSDVMQARTQAA
jgi:predicted unusual protein kinase regulating ubiquinone biosynthesis (AarF/ABC1/UbiB family)